MTALTSPPHTWPLPRIAARAATGPGARHRATRARRVHPAQRFLTALMVGGLLAVALVVGLAL